MARQRGAFSARIADRAEVAGEHAAVPELLCGEVELRRDDERLEQALADRLAQEQVSLLPLDRQCRTEWAEEVVDIDAGRHDHRVGRDSPERPRQLPAVTRPAERVDGDDPDVDVAGDRLHCGLRLVEVPVLRTPGRPGQLLDRETRDELGCLGGRDDPRCDTFGVLHHDVPGQARERVRAVSGEEVPAGRETERYRARQALLGLAPPHGRLPREPACRRRPPLLADTARLHA